MLGFNPASVMDPLSDASLDFALQLGLHLFDDMPALPNPILDFRRDADQYRRSESPPPEAVPLFVLHGCDPLCLPTHEPNGLYALGLPSNYPGRRVRPGETACFVLDLDIDLPHGTYAILRDLPGIQVTHQGNGPIWKGRVTQPFFILTNQGNEDKLLYAGTEVLHLEFVQVSENRDFVWAHGTFENSGGEYVQLCR